MSDFGTIKARIATELDRSDLTTVIGVAVISAIHRYSHERFRWNVRKFTAATTVAGTDEYALPTTDSGGSTIRVIEIDQLMITIGSGRYKMEPRTAHVVDDMKSHATTTRGRPRYYAIINERFRVYPVPDDAYVIDGFGLCDINVLTTASADGATNAWLQYAYGEELIRASAKADLAENIVRSPERAAAYLGQAHARFEQLKAAQQRLEDGARVEAWD